MIQTLKDIGKTIAWYDGLHQQFNDIDLLLNARRKLSARLFYLAQNLADASRDKNAAEHVRKAFEASRRHELKEAAKDKPVLSHIETQVAYEAIPHAQRESEFEREYQALKIVYGAAVNVCDVMNQHIANLRSEKSREMSGGGSQ